MLNRETCREKWRYPLSDAHVNGRKEAKMTHTQATPRGAKIEQEGNTCRDICRSRNTCHQEHKSKDTQYKDSDTMR